MSLPMRALRITARPSCGLRLELRPRRRVPRWNVAVLLGCLAGCYTSHEREDEVPMPRDAGIDQAAPPPDATVDAVITCTEEYTRTDVRPGVVRPGRPASVGRYLVWIPNQSNTTMAWYDRASDTLERVTIHDVQSHYASVVATPFGALAAWERTGPRGAAMGVFVAAFPDRPGPPVEVFEVSPTGGQPFLVYEAGRTALIAYQDRGTWIAEIDASTGEFATAPTNVDGDTRAGLGAVASQGRYFIASSGALYSVEPSVLVTNPLARRTVGRPFTELAANDEVLVTGTFGGVTTFDFTGAEVADRDVPFTGLVGGDVWVAGFQEHLLVTPDCPEKR
ncbi:MAG: hypothetical protein AAGF12_18165 [Myxococcota bacterium]